jgi:hypothetical protein
MIARRALALAVVAALAAASLGLTCGPGGAPPVTDTCEPPAPPDAGEPNDGALTSLELGYLGSDGAFVPFVDGGVAYLSFGGQGSSMIVAHLRARGADVPACLAQRTVMETITGETLASEDAGLPTDPTADGARITSAMYLVYDRSSGEQVRLRATAGGLTRTLTVWINFDPSTLIDAGVDAP